MNYTARTAAQFWIKRPSANADCHNLYWSWWSNHGRFLVCADWL